MGRSARNGLNNVFEYCISALGSTGTVSVPVSVSASFFQSICWDRIPPNGGHTKSHTVVTTSESATAAAAAHI